MAIATAVVLHDGKRDFAGFGSSEHVRIHTEAHKQG